MSALRAVRKRKKVRKLGSVTMIRREAYADLELDAKVELIRPLVPLGLMHVQELLDQEVTALASERYARKAASVGGRRHGSNPGTVGLADQRVPAFNRELRDDGPSGGVGRSCVPSGDARRDHRCRHRAVQLLQPPPRRRAN